MIAVRTGTGIRYKYEIYILTMIAVRTGTGIRYKYEIQILAMIAVRTGPGIRYKIGRWSNSKCFTYDLSRTSCTHSLLTRMCSLVDAWTRDLMVPGSNPPSAAQSLFLGKGYLHTFPHPTHV